MKKRISIPNVLCAVMLCMYLFAIQIARQIAEYTYIYYKNVFLIIWLLIAVFLTCVFLRSKGAASRGISSAGASGKECVIWFCATLAISLCVLLTYYFAFYPGAYSPDSYDQLEQAQTGIYDDWHPFIHTLLFFTLPLKLFGGRIEFIVLMQLLWFSVALGYLNYSLRANGCSRLACFAELMLVLLSPATGNIMMYPWKDCGLTIFAVVLAAQYVNIVCTNGMWLKKPANFISFIVISVLTTLVRHNAVLFVLPLFTVTVLLCIKRSKLIAGGLIGGYIMVLLLIKGPVYSLYNVEKPDRRIVETTGACMTVMGDVLLENPDALPEYIKDFLYEVAPQKVWEESYRSGSFNSIKWHEETDTNVIDEAGYGTILRYTIEAIKADKAHALRGFLSLTDMIWKIDVTGAIYAGSCEEETDITVDAATRGYCLDVVNIWAQLVHGDVAQYLFYCVGLLDLLIIAFSLSDIARWSELLRGVHALPILCYNFGTALLLTGSDWRFFFYTFPVFIPFAFLILRKNEKDMAL